MTEGEIIDLINRKLEEYGNEIIAALQGETLKAKVKPVLDPRLESVNVPIGSIMLWPLETDPVNTRESPQWLVCHKDRTVSREEYPELFKLIGVGWGEGDYETTFNLPEPYDTPRGMNYIIRAK